MHSRRALGIIALVAVVLAAVSFAVVDVSIANANGCVGSTAPCSDRTIPAIALFFAALGTIALLASIIPAFTWFTHALQHARTDEHDEADLEVSRGALVRRRGLEEEDA